MKLLLVIFSCVCFARARDYKPYKLHPKITDYEYYNLPVLFHFDDFDACLSRNPALYCFATIQLKPMDARNISNTWKNIQELIETPRMYRHDRLRHGICLPVTFPDIPPGIYAAGNGSDDFRKEISEKYSRKYYLLGLRAEVTEMHCQDRSNVYEIDYLDTIFAACVLSLLLLIIASTFYETCKKQIDDSSNTVFGAFSLKSNYRRLFKDNTSDMSKSLCCFNGVRVYNIMLVVLTHTVMLIAGGPVYNPKYLEDSFQRAETSLITNGSLICQTYFLLSAWLLSHYIFSTFENRKISFRELLVAFIQRYYRLAPLLMFSVGFSATWLRHFGDGPFWHKYVDDEFQNCRKNWWLNMIFLNNYVNSSEMCLQQTWYIAAEMQCFVAGLFVLMLVVNKPKHAKTIFATAVASSILISIGHNYYMDYDIVYRSSPETLYTLYFELEQWTDTFVAGHIAFPAYFQGLIFGYYFYKFKKAERTIKFETQTKYWTWVFFTKFISIGTITVAALFYREGFECSRFEAALYQGLCRYVFALAIGQLIFVTVFGGSGIIKHFLTCKPYQYLARITFAVYLTHVWGMRVRYGTNRTPTYLSTLVFANNFIADWIVALFFGLLVCLCVEMPMSALEKVVFVQIQPADETKKSH